MKVYQAIAEVLAREGVQAVFAVMGDANMRFLVELRRFSGVRVYYARHENSAVAMADGYARATGGIGVCTVTCGPGLALTADSLVTARNHGSPLLLIAGDTPTGVYEHIQELDQRSFAETLGVVSLDMTKADAAVEDLSLAVSLALSRATPVVLNVPTDLQDLDHRWDVDPTSVRERLPSPPQMAGDAASLAAAVDRLIASERPIVIAGRGASGARSEIVRVADRVGALVSTTLLAKGLFAGDPFDLGIAGLFSQDRAQELFAEADLVVAVGAALSHYTTEGGLLFPNAAVVQIDARPFSVGPGRRIPELYLQGDARTTLSAIAAALETGGHRRAGLRTSEIAASLEEMRSKAVRFERRSVDGVLDPREAMTAIDAAVSGDALFVIGMGHFWWFAINYLSGGPGRSFMFSHDFGSIGQALPLAIGAAIGLPGTRVIAVEGDASILMCVQELDTAARYGIPVWGVVVDDGGVAAEYHHLRAVGMDPNDAVIRSPDLAIVARGFGATAAEVRDLDALRTALADRAPGPHLLDLRIAREVIAEPYRKLWYPDGGPSQPAS